MVPASSEKAFRRSLREVGYVLATGDHRSPAIHLWKLLGLEIDVERMTRILPKKLAVKGLTTPDLVRMFPDALPETLQPYWERELNRLAEPVPEMSDVLEELRQRLMVLTPSS